MSLSGWGKVTGPSLPTALALFFGRSLSLRAQATLIQNEWESNPLKLVRGTVERDFPQSAVVSEHYAVTLQDQNVACEPAFESVDGVFVDCSAVVSGWLAHAIGQSGVAF